MIMSHGSGSKSGQGFCWGSPNDTLPGPSPDGQAGGPPDRSARVGPGGARRVVQSLPICRLGRGGNSAHSEFDWQTEGFSTSELRPSRLRVSDSELSESQIDFTFSSFFEILMKLLFETYPRGCVVSRSVTLCSKFESNKSFESP